VDDELEQPTVDDADMASLESMLEEQRREDGALGGTAEPKPRSRFPWTWVLLAAGLVLAMLLGIWYSNRRAASASASASSSTPKGASPVLGSTTNNITVNQYFYGGANPAAPTPGPKPPKPGGTATGNTPNPGGNTAPVPQTSMVSLQNANNADYAKVGTTFINGPPDTTGNVAYRETVTGPNTITVQKITPQGVSASYTQAARTYFNLLHNPVGAPVIPGDTRNQIITAQREADVLYYRYGVKSPAEYEALLRQAGAGSAASRLAHELASTFGITS